MASTFWGSRLRMAGIVLLLVCVILGALYSSLLPATVRFPDEGEYLNLTGNLLHGPGYSMDGVHLTAMRPPGYPFFLAGIEALGGGMVAMRIVQYFLFAGTLLLLCQVFPTGNRFASLLAVTGVAMLYPALFYTSSTLYPQTLSAFLFILAMVLLLKTPRGFLSNLATGLVLGALLLVVPTFALTLPVLLLAAWFLKIVRWHEGIPIALGVVLIVSVWIGRNEMVFNKFIPFASNSGENLLLGNCENTTPDGAAGVVDISHYVQEAKARGLDEFQTDNYFRQAALTWIRQNPTRALVLYLKKTANFFNLYNSYAPGTKAEASPAKQVVMGASYILLLGLLAWRLAEAKRFPLLPREKLFLIVYVLTAFTMAIFFTRIRHRLPYDYLVVAIVAMHLGRRLQLWLEPKA